jgi:hypothetical protein
MAASRGVAMGLHRNRAAAAPIRLGYRVIKNRPPRHDPYRRYWYGNEPAMLEQSTTKLVMMVPHNVKHHDKNGTVSTLWSLVSVGGRFVAADQLILVPLLVLLNIILFWNI